MTNALRQMSCSLLLVLALSLGLVVSGNAAEDVGQTAGQDWPRFGRTWKEDHYSPLDQINASTIDRLGLAWSYDLPIMASSGASSPLAVDGVLYFAVSHSIIHAMNAATGELLWQYDPRVHEVAGHKLRAGWGVRGIAYDQGKIFTATLDGRLLALEASSGKLLWSTQTTEDDDGRYITGQPYVMNGKVIIGHGGADYQAVRGYVTAYDADTGKQAWRFYTVPGNPADGFENKAMEMAAKTWSGEWWKFGGGGTAWNSMAYDAELNRIYIGTGNGDPWNQKIRSPGGGDNLFLCAILALDADTGEYLWHYQVNPGETWDFNSAMGIQLADIEIDGKSRKVILHTPKNGFFYVLDRLSGKLISAEPFAKITWAERIDLDTGRPVEIPAARYPEGTGYLMFPSAWGAHGVEEMSFNHKTGLVYLPARDMGAVYANPPDIELWKHQGIMIYDPGLGIPPEPIEVPPAVGWLAAWDPAEQREVWRVELGGSHHGGTLTTAGNLVMQGRANGELSVYAADTGTKLWSFDAQNGIFGHPITYLVEGKQYISLLVGWRGPSQLEDERWSYRQQKPRVLTFALDGTQKLPVRERQVESPVDDSGFVVDDGKAELGMQVYNRNCNVCHGIGLLSGGAAPDLRYSPVAASLDSLAAVLQGGVLKSRGMPQYEEMPNAEVEALQHFIRKTARAETADR